MKGVAVCVFLGVCSLFVQRTSSTDEHAFLETDSSGLPGLYTGPDRQVMEGWRSARYAGRRTLKHGDYVVLKKSSSTPSPPPPSVIIIKKTSAPSPPPPSATVIKKIIKNSPTPSPPPPSKKVFNKFPFFGKWG